MFSKSYFKVFVVLFVPLFFAMSCDDDGDSSTSPAVENAKIRVIHASYDAPAVDVRVDDGVAVGNLAYGESSGYAELMPGTRNVKVAPAGQTSPVVIEADIPITEDKEYTVIAVDQLSDIGAVVAEDNRTTNPNKAKLRFVHASPDAPAVDIKVEQGTNPAVFSDASFKDVTDYVEVDAGSYQFVVTPAGGTTEVLAFNEVPVQNGMIYTVVAHGTFDPTDSYPFAVRVFVDNDPGSAFVDLTIGTANVLVTHASPDAPGVDLLIDDMVVNIAALTFPNNTGYLSVNAGTRNVKVNASGTSTTVINADLTLNVNENYSVFAVNTLSNIEALVLEDNLSAPASGKAHVRFIHLSPDAPAVNITTPGGSTIVFENVAFKEYVGFTPLDAGTYDLEVRDAETNSTVVLSLNGINFSDGKIYTVFANGFATAGSNPGLSAAIIENN